MANSTSKDICKRVAEIEGLKLSEEWNCLKSGIIIVEKYDSVGEIQKQFNPLADKALCFDLMIKHEIQSKIVDELYFGYGDMFFTCPNPCESICMAVMAKHAR